MEDRVVLDGAGHDAVDAVRLVNPTKAAFAQAAVVTAPKVIFTPCAGLLTYWTLLMVWPVRARKT